MRYFTSIILLFSVLFVPLYGANGNGAGRALSEESLTNMKYDREFLTDKRDAFIEFNGDLPVMGISVKGLKKTSRDIVLREAGIATGAPLSSFDPHIFINRMKNLQSR